MNRWLWPSFVLKVGLFGLALTSNLWAEPENPTPYTIDNLGDTLTIQRFGDEHYNFAQTIDGYLILQDSTGCFYYGDESGNITSIKAKGEGSRSAMDWKFLKSLDRKASFRSHRKNNPDRLVRQEPRQRAKWLPTVDKNNSRSSEGDLRIVAPRTGSLQKVQSRSIMALPSPLKYSKGTNRFPVILAAGSGTSNCDSLEFYNRLNQVGYNKNGHVGSVRDYFVDQSSGLFVPVYDVYLVNVPNTLTSYSSNVDQFVVDALTAFKNKYPNVDVTKYDADNNGEVDVVAVIFAGARSQYGLSGQQYALKWKSTPQLIGGKKFDKYFITAQMEDSRNIKNIGSFVHEFGHVLGLADHYSVYNSNTSFTTQYQGAHAWDVMATGMYNNSGATPPSYSAFEKNFLGWMDYTSLDTVQKVTVIPPLQESNVAYKIPVSGRPDEWFILENRQLTKWDSYLPNHGMLIWHIDYVASVWNSDRVNDTENHQYVDIVEAGNLVVTSYNDGFKATHLKDDSFPGSQNITSYGPFKSWGGVDLGVSLYGIMEEENDVCFTTQSGVKVSTCKVASSSSSAVVVSSSNEISTVPSSSSAVASSSSDKTEAVHLNIDQDSNALKNVAVFDMLGNKLLSKDFRGEKYDIDFRPFAGKVLVVRVTQNGRLLKQSRVSVK